VVQGRGALTAPNRVGVEGANAVELEASAIVLATGSEPVELPFLRFDARRIVSSTEALSFDSVPAHLVVIGAGAVGLELGSVWLRLGARVTVVEMLPRIAPFADRQLTTTLQRALKQQGMDFRIETRVTAGRIDGEEVLLSLQDAKGQSEELRCDRVLVAVGRRPYTDGLGLDRVGIQPGPGGRLDVDTRYQTKVPGIYAIGDLIAGPMLAHKAHEEGIAVAELIAGKAGHVNYGAIPNVVYTHPELAMVGLTEEELKERHIEYRTGRSYLKANARAKTMASDEGLVKVLADAKTDRLLGVHILAPHASELIGEAVVAFEFEASAEDLARTSHAHPTLSEVIKEAAEAVDRRSIHG
jgi:dihydrolipoamide dehydrogenase